MLPKNHYFIKTLAYGEIKERLLLKITDINFQELEEKQEFITRTYGDSFPVTITCKYLRDRVTDASRPQESIEQCRLIELHQIAFKNKFLKII